MYDATMDAIFKRTQYRVRLARGSYAIIRIGQPLPAPLIDLLPRPDAPWSFITAWNPLPETLPVFVNRARQHELLLALHEQQPLPVMRAGVGVGDDPPYWHEPNVFVAGLAHDTVIRLLRPYHQLAVVHGQGMQPAELHWQDRL